MTVEIVRVLADRLSHTTAELTPSAQQQALNMRTEAAASDVEEPFEREGICHLALVQIACLLMPSKAPVR